MQGPKFAPGFLARTWLEGQNCSAIVASRCVGLGEILACFAGTDMPGYDCGALRAEDWAQSLDVFIVAGVAATRLIQFST